MRTVVNKKCIENVIFVHLNDKNMSNMQKINEKKRVFVSLNYVFLATKINQKSMKDIALTSKDGKELYVVPEKHILEVVENEDGSSTLAIVEIIQTATL